MKNVCLYLVAILIHLLTVSLSAQTVSDTVFLLKEKKDNIFIEPDKNSVNYNYLSDFSSFPKESITNKILDLPAKWMPLHLYKSNYYLYKPCDLGTSLRICLSNNKIAFERFELYSYKINSKLKKFEDSHYEFTYKDFYKKNICVGIYIIDKLKMIAVFKYIKNANEISYQLMTDPNNAKQFQIIINDCRFNKAIEFKFDTLDFEKLIKEAN